MIKNKTEKLRFGAVGVLNTAIDFGLLFGLRAIGFPDVPANLVSTSASFCFSFLANKKYTFQTNNTNVKREIMLFIVVTLFGLWVLQSVIIAVFTPMFTDIGLENAVALLLTKIIATVVTLVWNYMLYAHVVFKKPNPENK